MRRTILGYFILAVIGAAGTLGAVAAGNGLDQSPSGIPNPCAEAHDKATMATQHRGYSWSSDRGPVEVFSNQAGNCVVRFEDREHSAPLGVAFKWDGQGKETIPVDPFKEVRTLGLIYTYDWLLKADGSYEFQTYAPLRQWWWCGVNIGECVLATYDAFFSAECVAAGKDPAYSALHRAGTGPACLGHRYQKLETGEVVVVE